MRHALAIAGCAAVIAAAVVLLRADDVGDRGPPRAALARESGGPRGLVPAEVLRDAARVARRQPAPGGAYWYARAEHTQLRIAGGNGTGYRHIVRERRESWLDSSGQGRRRGTSLAPWEFPTEADRREAGGARGGRPGEVAWDGRISEPARFFLGGRELTLRQIERLPTEPHALLADLRRGAEDSELLFQVADLLAVAPLPPPRRAALFEAISLLPDLTAGTGGRAVAVRLVGRSTETHLALDPRRARIELLSSVLRRARPGTRNRAGDVTTTIAYRAAGPVASLESVSAARRR